MLAAGGPLGQPQSQNGQMTHNANGMRDVQGGPGVPDVPGVLSAYGARKAYQAGQTLFSGTRDQVKVYLEGHGGPWKYKSGSFSRPEKGPCNYVCAHTGCNAECRVLLVGSVWKVQTPEGQQHQNHEENAGLFLRKDSIFKSDFEHEVRMLFDTGASPTEVFNTLRQTTHPRVAPLVPADLTVEHLRSFRNNSKRVAYKIANLNELTAWMSGRRIHDTRDTCDTCGTHDTHDTCYTRVHVSCAGTYRTRLTRLILTKPMRSMYQDITLW